MDRRDFLKTTTAAAAASATAGGIALAGQAHPAPDTAFAPAALPDARALRTTIAFADSIDGPRDAADRVLSDITRATNGRFDFGPPAHAPTGLAAIASGNAEVVIASPNADLETSTAFACFAGLPGSDSLSPHELHAWLNIGGAGDLWDELSHPHGAKCLLVGHTGVAPALWSTKPISGIGDLEGLKVAANGLTFEVLRGLGADVRTPAGGLTDLANADVAAALGDGTLDAVEVGSTTAAMQTGVATVASHATDTGVAPHGEAIAIMISRDIWDGLSDADRLVISAIADRAYITAIHESHAQDVMMRRFAEQKYAVGFTGLPPEARTTVDRITAAVIAHAASRDHEAARVFGRARAFKRMISGDASPPSKGGPLA